MSSTAGPSAVTPESTLTLLTNLPLTHPSFEFLLLNHSPLAYPSILPLQQVNKLLGRLNSAILARDNENERRLAWRNSKEIVLQDTEGYALTNWGKSWMNAALTAITTSGLPFSSLMDPLHLLSTIVIHSSLYPSFEREVIHPIMGKVALTLSRLLERCLAENQSDWTLTVDLMNTTKAILEHSPASFRPVAPNIRIALRTIILCLPASPVDPSSSAPQIVVAPIEARQSAAELIAALPLTAGKAQSSAAWGVAIREAIGGISQAVDGIARDGWEEEPVKIVPPAAPAALLSLPIEPAARLVASLDRLEGFTEEILALLRFTSSRNVPLPIAQLVAVALRCLNITLDTPCVSYISPQHHAALLSSLPRIWTSGILLIGSVAASCGDHLLPHLSTILDQSVWLVERTPESMTDIHLQLVNFHRYIFDLYPPACSPVDYSSRLLRSCLSRSSPLLDSKPSVMAAAVNGGGGKRGKKRARGAEDGLIGGLEGRESRAIPEVIVEVMLASLQLACTLHSAPLLSPALLTFSIRLHLSLHLHLASASKTAFVNPSHLLLLVNGVADVLHQALYLTEGEQGTQRGWKSAILAVVDRTDERTSILLHPSLPPVHRPHPPLDALHYFAKETEEERRLRRELGYSTAEDLTSTSNDDGDDDMQVDVSTQAVPMIKRVEELHTHSAISPTVASTQVSTSASPFRMPIIPMTSSQSSSTVAASSALEPIPNVVTSVGTLSESASTVPIAAPFMSAPVDKGKTKIVEQYVETTTTTTSTAMDEDDEPLPELDSGSSDEDEEEDEEEVEED